MQLKSSVKVIHLVLVVQRAGSIDYFDNNFTTASDGVIHTLNNRTLVSCIPAPYPDLI